MDVSGIQGQITEEVKVIFGVLYRPVNGWESMSEEK